MLVLEDLHWGDEATFDVVRLLARRMDVPGLVVATYRDDGLDRNHPLRVLVGDLATATAVSRLSLGFALAVCRRAARRRPRSIDPGDDSQQRSARRPAERSTQPGSPTTPKPLATSQPCRVRTQGSCACRLHGRLPRGGSPVRAGAPGRRRDAFPAAAGRAARGRSRACYLADDQVEAIAVVTEAVQCRREQGAPADEARDLTELSSYLVCRGQLGNAREAMNEATRLIEGADESAQVAFVEAYRAVMAWVEGDAETALERAWRAREMALRAGERRTAVNSLVTVGSIELQRDVARGRELLEQAMAEGREAGYTEQVARALNNLGAAQDPVLADLYLPQALEYCVANSEDLWRINVLAIAARNALDRGRWTEAADFAERLLHDPRESPWPHHEALVVLALVRARRGDPGAGAALDEAAGVRVPADDLGAHLELAAARAEVAWLEQRTGDVEAATERALADARGGGAEDGVARALLWRLLAGLPVDCAFETTGAYALALSERWEEAAAVWERVDSPYEAALARIESNDEDSLRLALTTLQKLGALPAAQLATRRLRALGAKGVTRGPRRATRENAAGLTPRETEVLALIAEGRRNAEIAQQLYLSRRTVDHHVSALLRKLDAGSRVEAVLSAQRLGLLQR